MGKLRVILVGLDRRSRGLDRHPSDHASDDRGNERHGDPGQLRADDTRHHDDAAQPAKQARHPV